MYIATPSYVDYYARTWKPENTKEGGSSITLFPGRIPFQQASYLIQYKSDCTLVQY